MQEIKLYRKNSNSIGTWRIWNEGSTIRIAHATVIGGSEVHHREEVETNLSGRTIEEQVALRIRSRVSRMMDKGYKTSIEEAQKSQSNQLGLERPMLAHPIERVNNVNYSGSVLQKKLDGHRCLVTRQDGELIAYSRQGKRIDAIRHILRYLDNRIPEGTTLDGELYCHGHKLQTLASWIKREQPDTLRLFFVVYDLISAERYVDRHAELKGIVGQGDTGVDGKVVALPYEPYQDAEHASLLFRKVRDAGFEGLMLRTDGRGYEAGKRSSSLLKIKEFHDEEFQVVGFERSKTGWAICKCVTKTGAPFDCSAPGSVEEKMEVWENQEKYFHRFLTVQFAHWTEEGIPFQPTALRWEVKV